MSYISNFCYNTLPDMQSKKAKYHDNNFKRLCNDVIRELKKGGIGFKAIVFNNEQANYVKEHLKAFYEVLTERTQDYIYIWLENKEEEQNGE